MKVQAIGTMRRPQRGRSCAARRPLLRVRLAVAVGICALIGCGSESSKSSETTSSQPVVFETLNVKTGDLEVYLVGPEGDATSLKRFPKLVTPERAMVREQGPGSTFEFAQISTSPDGSTMWITPIIGDPVMIQLADKPGQLPAEASDAMWQADSSQQLEWPTDLSPDGTRIAYWETLPPPNWGSELHTVNADGSDDVVLSSTATPCQGALNTHAWSHDSKRVAWIERDEVALKVRIRTAYPDGSGMHTLREVTWVQGIDGEDESHLECAWSPMDPIIAVHDLNGWHLIDAEGEAPTIDVSLPPEGTVLGPPGFNPFSWSPDGAHYAALDPYLALDHVGRTSGGQPKQLDVLRWINWSSDSRYGLYGDPEDTLHIFDLDTNEDRAFSPNSAAAQWDAQAMSPDSAHVAFLTFDKKADPSTKTTMWHASIATPDGTEQVFASGTDVEDFVGLGWLSKDSLLWAVKSELKFIGDDGGDARRVWKADSPDVELVALRVH